MTDNSNKGTYLSFLWHLTSPIFPFIIFLILGVFELDFYARAGVVGIIVAIWVGILLIGFVRDWEKTRFERFRSLTRSDAIVTLWHTHIDMNEDGSATIVRKIIGRNLTKKRKFYEFESQADLEMSPEYEQETRQIRTMDISVSLKRKDGSLQRVFTNQSYEPKIVRKVDALTHVIPLVRPSEGIPALEPNEEFEIDIKENVKPGTFLMTGDYYIHRVRHFTEELTIELLLPEGWRFPRRLRVGERKAVGEVKSPTTGEWEEPSVQPTTRRVRGREKITWNLRQRRVFPYGEIKIEEIDPRLLHLYRVTYCRLEKTE